MKVKKSSKIAKKSSISKTTKVTKSTKSKRLNKKVVAKSNNTGKKGLDNKSKFSMYLLVGFILIIGLILLIPGDFEKDQDIATVGPESMDLDTLDDIGADHTVNSAAGLIDFKINSLGEADIKWVKKAGDQAYWIALGKTKGKKDIYYSDEISNDKDSILEDIKDKLIGVNKIHLSFWIMKNGKWMAPIEASYDNDFIATQGVSSATPTIQIDSSRLAQSDLIVSSVEDKTLVRKTDIQSFGVDGPSGNIYFYITDNPKDKAYYFEIGTERDLKDIYYGEFPSTQKIVAISIPDRIDKNDLDKIYVKFWSKEVGGTWGDPYERLYLYKLWDQKRGGTFGEITKGESHIVDYGIDSSGDLHFHWTMNDNDKEYFLQVGSEEGGKDIYYDEIKDNTSLLLVEVDKEIKLSKPEKIYVKFWTRIDGDWGEPISSEYIYRNAVLEWSYTESNALPNYVVRSEIVPVIHKFPMMDDSYGSYEMRLPLLLLDESGNVTNDPNVEIFTRIGHDWVFKKAEFGSKVEWKRRVTVAGVTGYEYMEMLISYKTPEIFTETKNVRFKLGNHFGSYKIEPLDPLTQWFAHHKYGSANSRVESDPITLKGDRKIKIVSGNVPEIKVLIQEDGELTFTEHKFDMNFNDWRVEASSGSKVKLSILTRKKASGYSTPSVITNFNDLDGNRRGGLFLTVSVEKPNVVTGDIKYFALVDEDYRVTLVKNGPDKLKYKCKNSFTNKPNWLKVIDNDNNCIIHGTPRSDDVGIWKFIFRDGGGHSGLSTYVHYLTVGDKNPEDDGVNFDRTPFFIKPMFPNKKLPDSPPPTDPTQIALQNVLGRSLEKEKVGCYYEKTLNKVLFSWEENNNIPFRLIFNGKLIDNLGGAMEVNKDGYKYTKGAFVDSTCVMKKLLQLNLFGANMPGIIQGIIFSDMDFSNTLSRTIDVGNIQFEEISGLELDTCFGYTTNNYKICREKL